MNIEAAASILVVDDDAFILDAISLLLKEYGYHIVACRNAEEAMNKFQINEFDAVLTDIKMPEVSGIALLEKIHTLHKEIPVMLMTAYAELDVAVDAIKQGAFDFIIKPYKPEYLLHSIKRAVNYSRLIQMEKNYKHRLELDVRKRTQELAEALSMLKSMNMEIVHRLTIVSEFRDTDTGAHIKRIGFYSAKLAEALDMSEEFVETIMLASTMHDIGKIGIPDNILLKPAALTPTEFEVMKTHTTVGENMLADSPYPHLQMATVIALNHHEKWNGTGYPDGLKGEDIPIEARMVIIADQYDAMRSKRPYKRPFTHEETFRIITEGDERAEPAHFDPRILKAFIKLAPRFNEIFEKYKD